MNKKELFQLIKRKRSFLCIGLDSDLEKIPAHLLDYEDPVFEFNKQIIEATLEFTVAYKPNLAFYESRGSEGIRSLEKTIAYLSKYQNEVFTIADAKRGDIGNTSTQYAKAFLETYGFDAITVAPYMGKDSVTPFLAFENKWVILLALTSNEGAFDFQLIENKKNGKRLFEEVIETSKKWGTTDNLMYVVGATKAEMLADIRKIVPEHFLLVPGIGAQGGSLEDIARSGLNSDCGLLVNSSRGIIFKSNDKDFANIAGEEARKLQSQMEQILKNKNII